MVSRNGGRLPVARREIEEAEKRRRGWEARSIGLTRTESMIAEGPEGGERGEIRKCGRGEERPR